MSQEFTVDTKLVMMQIIILLTRHLIGQAEVQSIRLTVLLSRWYSIYKLQKRCSVGGGVMSSRMLDDASSPVCSSLTD
jgi:hypothetical protein